MSTNLTKETLRIIFLGTPDFAVASLAALVDSGYNVVAVVTAPDKPAGRGMKLQQSAVKKYAIDKGIQVLQPEKLKNPEFLEQLRAINADLQAVVAFRMLPEVVWNMPSMGTVNVHASLLPQYRGAAPINWALINGEKETGVTTFKLQHEIDTGNILLQDRVPITQEETAGELHDKLKEVGAALLVKTVDGLIENTIKEQAQSFLLNTATTAGETPKHAPKIFTDTCRIDWNKNVTEIHNLIRGLSSYPAAFTQLNGKTLKIIRAEKEEKETAIAPGEIVTDKKQFLKFACPGGFIKILELQLEGKSRLSIEDFLRGYRSQ